jgi:hypothetical protein
MAPPSDIQVEDKGISKMQAAFAQLDTAIRLYFGNCDPISTHTLTFAAAEIVDRLCDSRGLTSMRKQFKNDVHPDRWKDVADAMNRAGNFFKHASSSKPGQLLNNFTDEWNLLLLIFATDGLRQLGESTPITKLFAAWVSAVEPELMRSPMSDQYAALLADVALKSQPEQKQLGRDALRMLVGH